MLFSDEVIRCPVRCLFTKEDEDLGTSVLVSPMEVVRPGAFLGKGSPELVELQN